ncbi:hemolysin family protein [Stappia sp. TSB10P1A]|uniref:hemolysin family protein n=1 Tax=Stappia sp. TSB10P1A TaxID=2003585 RepID=UPI001643C6B9|nr:hemolysin family protein [Stappia sp. TSB10P1A]
MNDTEVRSTTDTPASPGAAAGAAAEAAQTDDEPQRSLRSVWSDALKRLAGLRRPGNGAGTLRQNLQDELAREADDSASFTPEERILLSNILRLREVRVEDVMVPRADIDAVEDSVSVARLMDVFRESGHSRMPVYHDGLDDPRGMVHIKDLMAFFAGRAMPEDRREGEAGAVSNEPQGFDLTRIDLSLPLAEANLIRPVLFVPPSMPATDLMAKMQADRVQMALVIDEYGGTEGLVSLEDIVETVVGDIEDEHDEDEEAMIQKVADGVWVADPRVPIEEVEEALGTGFQLGDLAEEVDTLGGLVFTLVGRVPVRGELLTARALPGYEFEVLDADPRRIKRLRIRARRPEARHAETRRRLRRPDRPG